MHLLPLPLLPSPPPLAHPSQITNTEFVGPNSVYGFPLSPPTDANGLAQYQQLVFMDALSGCYRILCVGQSCTAWGTGAGPLSGAMTSYPMGEGGVRGPNVMLPPPLISLTSRVRCARQQPPVASLSRCARG